jgi:hypothetical protein
VDGKCTRLNNEQAGIKGPMMGGTEHKSISRIIGSAFVLGKKMGSVKHGQHLKITNCASGAIPSQNPKLEARLTSPLLNLSDYSCTIIL